MTSAPTPTASGTYEAAEEQGIVLIPGRQPHTTARVTAGILHGVVEYVGNQIAVERPFVAYPAREHQFDAGVGEMLALVQHHFIAEIGNHHRRHGELRIVAQQVIRRQRAAQTRSRGFDRVARLGEVEAVLCLGFGNL